MTSVLADHPEIKTEEDMHQFMEEVRSIPLLSPQQERELAYRSAEGDEEAIRHLVNANLRLVVAIARRYYSGTVPMLDLIQEGSIGLLTAARKFDYTKEVRFSTYATKWIRQGVIRCLMASNPIRVPAHTAELIRRVNEAQAALRQELGREPELEEVAYHCDMPIEKVKRLLQLQPKTCSLDAPEEDASAVVAPRATQPHQQLVREELIRIIEQLLSQLTLRQQQVLRLRFGMVDGKYYSLEQIGITLGISKERARQIEKEATAKLKILGSHIGLEDFLE